MSRCTEVVCDICGRAIHHDTERGWATVDVSENVGGYGLPDLSGRYDICKDCLEKWRDVLTAGLTGRVRSNQGEYDVDARDG